jgi:uncharacterized protein (DUF2141 family)
MRTILFMVVMAFMLSAVNAQTKLTIVVDGIEKTEGTLLVAVYDSVNYLKKPVYTGYARVKGEDVSVVIDSVATGEYAVSVMHDENDNKKLDTGAYGIPTEKTGFSNNAKGKMGPPEFKDSKFRIEEDSSIYITLWKYKLSNAE